MIVVRCRQCNKEISSLENQTRSCGCPNMMTVTGDILTASDLSKTIVVSRTQEEEKINLHHKIYNGRNKEENVKSVNLILKLDK